MSVEPRHIGFPALRCGVLIIGSLLWDDDDAGIRDNWRKSRLDLAKKIHVSSHLRYGRRSQSWGNTFTMILDAGAPNGRGWLVPCRIGVATFADLDAEVRWLWAAEDKKALSSRFHKSWGCVGALFGPNAITAGLHDQWKSHFQAAKPDIGFAVDSEGKLDVPWPSTLAGEPVTDFDIILATATRPEPKEGRPNSGQLAQAWIDQSDGHERYFFENVRHGIRTRDDHDIWAAIEEQNPRWLKAGAYAEAAENLRMEEIRRITEKYDADYVRESLDSLDGLNRFALGFYKDVAEIYDCLTRIRNPKRNPEGFSLDDAPILGLLVRVWKLLKEIIKYYEQDNAQIISVLERPLIEASVISKYLMSKGPEVIEDYRKCSYKDRLRILRDLESGSAFFDTKAGQRLLKSVREKMAFEGLSANDFGQQKKNRWKVQGRNFYDIFAEVVHANLYACTYGMMSESIHGSWNESMDWDLSQNGDGTFSANPFNHSADIRYVTPALRFTTQAYRLWLQRIDAYDDNLRGLLEWVERVNAALFMKFDALFDE